jgi:hypothetical protein
MKELKELLHKCWIQAQKKLHDPLTVKGFKSFCDEHLKEPVKQDKCEKCGKSFIPVDSINYHCQECQPCTSIADADIKQDKGIEGTCELCGKSIHDCDYPM